MSKSKITSPELHPTVYKFFAGSAVAVFLFTAYITSFSHPQVLGKSTLLAENGGSSGGSGGGPGPSSNSGSGSSDSNNAPGSPAPNISGSEKSGAPLIPPPHESTSDPNSPKPRLILPSIVPQKPPHPRDDHEFTLDASRSAESENEIKTKDTLEKMNRALSDDRIEVSSGSGQSVIIRRGQIEAETHFPLSVDSSSHTMTITTPSGKTLINVLPDTAISNLVNSHVFTQTQTKVSLTEKDNQPVFEISGSDRQKLLGVIPVQVNKTAFVSPQTGELVQVQESTLNRILDFISF